MTLESATVEEIMTDLERKEEHWIEILSRLIQIPSENPPGDTVECMAYMRDLFDERGIPYTDVIPKERMPNVIAQYTGEDTKEGDRHLVFNGHVDTFPVSNPENWEHEPFGAEIDNGRIYGRGAADMYGGYVASLAAFFYLFEHREQFSGTVTFTAVSDEESGGAWGTKYILENYPEYHGDAVIVGEPSSNGIIRFGGRGTIWIELSARGASGHSAFPEGVNAIELLLAAISEIKECIEGNSAVPDELREIMYEGQAEMDAAFGPGATDYVLQTHVNINEIGGGEVINVTPEFASARIDIRLPLGASGDGIIQTISDIAAQTDGQLDVDVLEHSDPTYSDVNHPILTEMQMAAEFIRGGSKPVFLCGLPMTDARFYRRLGIPTAIYGPTPHNIGSQDEYIEIDQFMDVLKTHTVAGMGYLAS